MTRLKALLTISVFVFFYAVYYWAVPAVLNVQDRMPLIKSVIKKELGADVEIKDPKFKMGLIPSVWFEASYFGFVDGKSSPLSVTNPKVKIHLLPLILGKIHLAYFSCDKMYANLKFDKRYRFYIGDYLIIKNSNPKISIEDSKMDISGYEIKLKDEFQNKNIFLKGDYFDLTKYNSKKQIKLSMNARLKVNEHTSDINTEVDLKLPLQKSFDTNEIIFDGTITNLDLGDFSHYISKLSNNTIKQISGVLNVRADTKTVNLMKTRIATQIVIDKFAIADKSNLYSINFKNKLNINAIFDFAKNSLNIKKLEILSKTINLDLSGRVSKAGSKNPVLDLAVLINKSRIEDFISLLPNQNLKNVDINLVALKKYGYYSDISGKLKLKGKADRPHIYGDILSENGYIIKPLNIPKATVKLKFLGERVNINVDVPVGNNQKVLVKGPVDLYGDKSCDLDIKSTSNADLETTESILNPIHEIFGFDLGPLPIMKLQGVGDITLRVKGTKKDPHLFGVFNFRNTTASFDGIDMLLKNGEGSLYFKDKDTHFITRTAYLDEKPVKVDGKCSLLGDLDFDVIANGQDLDKLLDILKNSPMLADIQKAVPEMKSVSGKLNATLKLKGKVKNINEFVLGKTVIVSGNAKLLGNNISISNLQIPIRNLIGNIKFENTDADFDLYSGADKARIHIKGRVKDNALYSKIKLDDIAFTYFDIPVKILSGNLEINNDRLSLYKVNGVLDSMPVLIDGTVNNIFKEPDFNIYVNSKPSQKFIEKYINKRAVYPLKVKGDIIYSSRIKGKVGSFNAKAEIDLGEGSNIYYMGSTLGDANDPIRIFLDTNFAKDGLRSTVYVNNFQYDKLISSQNDKEFVSQQLNAKGQVDVYKSEINLHNFWVKTQNPTDARIFNIIFKKPMIKQGLFSSNVFINNSITSPKMLGFVNFTGIDIPLLDTTIKDISLDFRPNDVDIKSKGEIFSNKITIDSNMENKLSTPLKFNSIDIFIEDLNVNKIVERLSKLEIENGRNKITSEQQSPNITNFIIKSGKLKANKLHVKNLVAKNLVTDFSLNEKLIFALDNTQFEAAGGDFDGDFKYNLLTSTSSLNLNIRDSDANAISKALFDLSGQIYGSLTGKVYLTCNSKTYKRCMETLNGQGGFRVVDGRMPKLGSLEYLLKAANLIKSGVTGLTINSLVNLVAPLKTGEFENINGNFSINSGVADSIQIFSKGKDLSIFLTGTYNFSTLIADMDVFGRLSKKISSFLGTVGNTSLNTLFNAIPGLNLDEANNDNFIKELNKIPGFELNDKLYRIFSVKIYGDINGDNYVQSFKWVD